MEKLSQVIQIDEGKIQTHLGEVVRSTVEETLSAMLDAEADRPPCRAERYEPTDTRQNTRAGTYQRQLHTKVGEVTLQVPKLCTLPLEAVSSNPPGAEMRFSKKQIEPGIVVLEMAGRFLMGPDCQQVDREIEAHIVRDQKSIIFDLSAVEHVDSAAVGQIVKCYSKLKKSGGRLRLAGASGMVEGALKLTQVHKVIEIYPTVQEAAKNFPRASSAVSAKNSNS